MLFCHRTYGKQYKLLIFVSALPCCAYNYCSNVERDQVPRTFFNFDKISINTNATAVQCQRAGLYRFDAVNHQATSSRSNLVKCAHVIHTVHTVSESMLPQMNRGCCSCADCGDASLDGGTAVGWFQSTFI